MPLGVLFFTVHMHMAPTVVGLGLTIGGGVSLLLGPVGGHLVDEIGPKRALLGSWLLSAAAAASWVLVHNLLVLAIVESVQALAGGVGWNAMTALLAARSDEAEMSTVMATQYSLKNFGFGAGGLLSTLALAGGGIGFDLAVYANAASFLLGALLIAAVPAPPRVRAATVDGEAPTTIWTVLTDWRYVSLALLGSLIAFNQVGLSVVLPLWVVLRTHAPRALVGLMFTLNTVLVVTVQLRVSGRIRRLTDVPRAFRLAALAMLVAAGAYFASHLVGAAAAIVLLFGGTVLLTATEMLASACAFVVSLQLARPGHRGKYLSVFGLGWAIEGMVGPTAGTALVDAGAIVPWAGIAAAVASGALVSAAIVRRVRSVPEEAAGLAVR